MMNKDARILAVYGRRGSGKSTRVKALLRDYNRVVVLDVQGEYARLPGYIACRSLAEVKKAMLKRWAGTFKIAYVPQDARPKTLHDLCMLLFAAQKPYSEERDSRKILLVIEEANLTYPNIVLPDGQRGADRAVLQGRHYGIEILAVTQRPAVISTTLRSMCSEIYCLALTIPHDYKAVFEMIGKQHEAALRALQPHEFLHWDGEKVIKGKNKLV